jgi:uncharacterized membrane protein YkvA (DUF1232 family)
MIFRRRHQLPKFPPQVRTTFKTLCEVLPDEAIDEMRMILDQNIKVRLEENSERRNVDPERIRELYENSIFLLERYPQLSDREKSLAIGAVRYFAIARDAVPEEYFASGLDDDSQVMNYVLEKLGIEERFIEL